MMKKVIFTLLIVSAVSALAIYLSKDEKGNEKINLLCIKLDIFLNQLKGDFPNDFFNPYNELSKNELKELYLTFKKMFNIDLIFIYEREYTSWIESPIPDDDLLQLLKFFEKLKQANQHE